MKLLILFTLLLSPVFAETPWTHRTIEGEDGGANGDYYFYQTFTPKSGSDVMSVLKARVVYAYDYPTPDTIVVADYSFADGLQIRISHAKREDAKALFSGGDVEMKTLREYKVPFELVRGRMIRPRKGTRLTQVQQEDLFNLVHVLAMQRGKPPRSEQGDADQPATAVDSKAKGGEKPKPESKGRSQ